MTFSTEPAYVHDVPHPLKPMLPTAGLAGPVVPHGPMVYAASGANEVSLWGCDSGRCHEVLRVVPPHEPPEACLELPHALQPEQADAGGAGAAPGGLGADELDRHLALQELQAPQARIVGCVCMTAFLFRGAC